MILSHYKGARIEVELVGSCSTDESSRISVTTDKLFDASAAKDFDSRFSQVIDVEGTRYKTRICGQKGRGKVIRVKAIGCPNDLIAIQPKPTEYVAFQISVQILLEMKAGIREISKAAAKDGVKEWMQFYV